MNNSYRLALHLAFLEVIFGWWDPTQSGLQGHVLAPIQYVTLVPWDRSRGLLLRLHGPAIDYHAHDGEQHPEYVLDGESRVEQNPAEDQHTHGFHVA